MLLNQQSKSLRQLRLYQVGGRPCLSGNLPTTQLEAIECRSLDAPTEYDDEVSIKQSEIAQFIAGLVKKNAETLCSLELGQELELPHNLTDDHGAVLDALAPVNATPLKLSCLGLVGFDVDPNTSSFFTKSIEINRLRKLTLESCFGITRLLHQLAYADDETVDMKLSLDQFTFRHESPDQALLSSLEAFLGRIPGLTHLSVLLDNITNMPNVTCFTERHGPSLKTLVWEGRAELPQNLNSDRRASKSLGTICDSSSEVSRILKHCVNLEELSVPFDWHEYSEVSLQFSRTRKHATNRYKSHYPDAEGAGFLKSTKLRTLHVRNSPVHRYGNSGDYTIDRLTKTLAAQLLDYALEAGPLKPDKDAPKLELLVVGPLTLTQKWELQHRSRRYSRPGVHQNWDIWNRPTLFDVNFLRIEGVHRYILTQKNFTTTRAIQERYKTKVFDSVWAL
jgi:hypothetical protein